MPLAKDVIDEKSEERMLFEALDKGIDDMENGRMVSHGEAIRKIKEYIASYEIQVN